MTDLSHLQEIITPNSFETLRTNPQYKNFTVLVTFTDTRSEIGILNVTDNIQNPKNATRVIVKQAHLIDAMKQGKIIENSVIKITDCHQDTTRNILNIKALDVLYKDHNEARPNYNQMPNGNMNNNGQNPNTGYNQNNGNMNNNNGQNPNNGYNQNTNNNGYNMPNQNGQNMNPQNGYNNMPNQNQNMYGNQPTN